MNLYYTAITYRGIRKNVVFIYNNIVYLPTVKRSQV